MSAPLQRPTSTTAANTAANTAQTPKNPPPPLTIAPGATVADKASITGTHRITIARNATIHPFARLDSSTAEIEIGESTSVWEKATIGGGGGEIDNKVNANTRAASTASLPPPQKTSIGPYTTISPHAVVGAGAQIGAYTSVEVGARVGAGCIIGSHCRLAALTSVARDAGVDDRAPLEDFGVVYFAGDGVQQRRVNVSARDSARVRELEAKARQKEREVVARVVQGAAAGGKWQR